MEWTSACADPVHRLAVYGKHSGRPDATIALLFEIPATLVVGFTTGGRHCFSFCRGFQDLFAFYVGLCVIVLTCLSCRSIICSAAFRLVTSAVSPVCLWETYADFPAKIFIDPTKQSILSTQFSCSHNIACSGPSVVPTVGGWFYSDGHWWTPNKFETYILDSYVV